MSSLVMVVVVCKTQSEPEKGEMLKKNHDDDDDDDNDYDCENVTMSHDDRGNNHEFFDQFWDSKNSQRIFIKIYIYGDGGGSL